MERRVASTSTHGPHTHLPPARTSSRPSPSIIETSTTFLQPDLSTSTGTAEAGCRLETKHAGIAAGRRVFVGPSFEGQSRRAGPRGGAISPAAGGAGGKGKERARELFDDEGERSGFLLWRRRRRSSTTTSRKPTGETVPSSSAGPSSRTASNAQHTWAGTSFEIGGDVREAARRRDERLRREREAREKEAERREEERRRVVSAPAEMNRRSSSREPAPKSPAITLDRASFMTARTHLPSTPGVLTPNNPPQQGVGHVLDSASHPPRRPSDPSLLAPPSLLVDTASTTYFPTTSSLSPASPHTAPPSQQSPGLLTPTGLKPILRGKNQPYQNGSALGNGHPSSAPTASPLLAIPTSASEVHPGAGSDRPVLSPRTTGVRFPAQLDTRPVEPSGAQPPASPSIVLARSDAEADAAPASFPPPQPRKRERSDDVIKTARMLVKVDWCQRDDLPDAFDEHVARKFPTSGGEGWEELAVVWRRGGWIELWGEYKFNVPAAFLGRKKLKAVIPLRPKTTHLSLYSAADLIFCLTHRPQSNGVFGRSSHTLPIADPSAAGPADKDNDETKRRARHAKASKRGYVHLRSSGTNIFLFRARTHSAAKQWMWELYQWLGGRVPRTIEVSVPGLGAKVRLPVPQREREEGDGQTWAPVRATKITQMCVEQLSAVPQWKEVVEDSKRQGAEFRLAWRRDSILDWITEESVETRDWAVIGGGVSCRQELRVEPILELRPATHYPTTCRIPASETANPSKLSTTVRISEPPAIEGFLIRHRPNGTPERVYLSSRMGLLFLCRPSTAHAPEPPMSTYQTLNNPAAIVLGPLVFGMASLAAPSKKKKGQLLRRVSERGGIRRGSLSMKQEKRRDWTLKSMDAARDGRTKKSSSASGVGLEEHADEDDEEDEEDEDSDEVGGEGFLKWLADEEKRRAFLQITDARGFVNLSEIDSVEPELTDDHDPKEKWVKVDDPGGEEGLHAAEDKARLKKMRGFVVKTRSGVTVRFECYSISIREEWVDRLRALSAYWRRRERVDAIQLMELSPSSGLVNRIPPPSTSISRRHAYDGTIADDDGEPPPTRNDILSSPHLAHFYNHCILEGCRALMKQGVMHVKKGMRGVFRLRHVLILPGTLIEYQSIARDMHGSPSATPYHRRRLVVSLRDTYVYSGSLTSPYIPTTNAHSWDPGDESEHQFPRCYPGTDGLRTADDAEDCTFVLVRMRGGGSGKNKRLGQKATTVRVYRTRSKLERDQFVYTLNVSIEHLLRGEQEREERLRDFSWLREKSD
ncbi:hypothetical protein JCM11251_004875 [Rhodosporidiobolus azoricus]